jgi:chemotaxis protein methyltransferase CheR
VNRGDLARSDLDEFRAAVARRLGLHHDESRTNVLADVLLRRMHATGCGTAGSYLERLEARWADESGALAAELTVGETFFFRDVDQLRAVAERVLPERVAARGPDKRLRILSAGCASGEEPYSLAILAREALPDFTEWDVRVTAVDVNPVALARARAARFSAWSMRATPRETIDRWFHRDGRELVLDAGVRESVTFHERNLADDDPLFWSPAAYDLVLCRNVLMYFTPAAMRRTVDRLGEALLPGGFLFLGHAETLRGLTQPLALCHTHDAFYYRKHGTSEPVAAAPPLAHAPPPPATELLPSWADAIQRASTRIDQLARGTHAVAAAAAPSWDLAPALDAMRRERFSDALALLATLPAAADRDPEALLVRAALLTNCARLDECAETCRHILALDALNAGAHYLLALCREHDADHAGAIEHDRTAVVLDGSFAMPHLHLGLMAKRSGDPATAAWELSTALLLLGREDASRLLLFGGGFGREALLGLCRGELRALGDVAAGERR